MTPKELEEALQKRGISQAALADAVGLGLTRDKVNKVVKLKRQLRADELVGILAYFDKIDSGQVKPKSTDSIPLPQIAPNVGAFSELHLSGKLIPVFGQAIAGTDGRFILNGTQVAEVVCIPSLEKVPGAYAVFVSGDSMSPRFYSGETVYIHPSKPPRSGDDVVVQIQPAHDGDPPEGFIKKFISQNGDYLVLEQFNPPQTIKIPASTVATVHVIMGTSR